MSATGDDEGDAAGARPATTVVAPAKLTLSLRVVGVRPDGYHVLDAEMVSIDLADTLSFSPGDGLDVVDDVVGGIGVAQLRPGRDNLVSRALQLVELRSAVRLVKRIPVGAGLGGGSSDAAAVLWWARRWDAQLALRLGSDVPFCVRGGRARVRGVGEVVEPLTFEERRFVLLLPPLHVDTSSVYRAWDELSGEDAARIGTGSGRQPTRGRPTARRDRRAADDHGNDLEVAALAVAPGLRVWREAMARLCGRRPRLAGSGAAWFVEGDPDEVGIAHRRFVVVRGQRAPLVPVRTVPPRPGAEVSGP